MIDNDYDAVNTVDLGIDLLVADNQNDGAFGLVGAESEPPVEFQADTSLDFKDGNDTDIIDLADVLSGTPDSENINDYLLAISKGGSSTLLVDTGGTGNFANPDLVIEVGGVDWDSNVSGQLADLVNDAVIVVA